MNWSQYAVIIADLFAILNPIGAIPVFLDLTADQETSQRRHTALIAALAVAIILVISAWVGDGILKFFGLSIDAFRVGGGILILLMAVDMMHARPSRAKRTDEEHDEAQDKDSVAIVPLAIPLLAGPGAISTVILDAHNLGSVTERMVLTVIIIGLAVSVWLALYLATPISKWLGKTGNNILVRLMGLILMAIAVEFIITGVKAMWG
jgi:multiple antibiotic resistance protein